MFPPDLFNQNALVDKDTFRNIVSLRESVDLFDDLSDDPDDWAVAIQAESQTKAGLHLSTPAVIHKGFAYNTAIAYPFLTKPFLHTRFGDGSFGVWYGSMDLVTTIYETCYHIYNAIISSEGYPKFLKQERAVYTVHCDGILIDLTGRTADCPDLISNEYSFCHFIGKKLQKEGQPGILYTSARLSTGQNIAVFNPRILNDPQNNCFLTYIFSMSDKTIRIERVAGKALLTIDVEKAFA